MKILAAKPAVSQAAAVASILLAAGLTFDDPKGSVVSKQKNTLAPMWGEFEQFFLQFGGTQKKRLIRLFKEWCDNPPKSNSDVETDYKFEDFVAHYCQRAVGLKIQKATALSDEEIAVALSSMAWIKSGSNTAFLKLRKHGAAVGMPVEILGLLAAETSSQEKPARELTALFKQLGIQPTPNLSLGVEGAMALREKNPKAAKKYTDLRKVMIESYKVELQNYCRLKGGPQPIDEVRRHMQKQGFVVTKLPEGFSGKIGDDGKLYTTAGLELNAAPSVRVQMNPKYDAKADNGFVCTYKPTESSKPAYVFTLAWGAKQREEKFAVSRELEDRLDKVQRKYRADLKSTDPAKRTLATMLELQYLTAMRIGNPGNQTKNKDGTVEPTYGLSTLQVKHIKKRGAGFLIMFPGKAGVVAKYMIQPMDAVLKLVVKNIQTLLLDSESEEDGALKPADAYVFEDSKGRYNGERVNKYLRAVSGIQKLTNHKIRHMRGTKAAREIVADAPKRLDQKGAEKWFLEAMTKVGALLNHVKGVGSDQKVTPATAIKNYIDPELSLGFFRERGLRIPKFLAPLMRKP